MSVHQLLRRSIPTQIWRKKLMTTLRLVSYEQNNKQYQCWLGTFPHNQKAVHEIQLYPHKWSHMREDVFIRRHVDHRWSPLIWPLADWLSFCRCLFSVGMMVYGNVLVWDWKKIISPIIISTISGVGKFCCMFVVYCLVFVTVSVQINDTFWAFCF